jgi:hypothetical protein
LGTEPWPAVILGTILEENFENMFSGVNFKF